MTAAEQSGLHLSLKNRSPIPGPRAFPPPLGVIRYIRDPISWGQRMRPPSGEGVVTTAKGHSAMLVCFGERWARMCFSDMDTWVRPSGGLVRAPEKRPAVASLMRTIVLANGAEWQRRRKLSVPATHKENVLRGMSASFLRTAEELSQDWKGVIDARDRMLQLSLRNNVRCLMGLEPQDGEPVAKSLSFFTNALLDPLVGMTQALSDRLANGTPIAGTPYARWIAQGEAAERVLRSLIAKKREVGGTSDMLGALLAPAEDGESALTDDEAVGELAGLYAAGYETTAQTFTWILLMLATHPQIARAAQAEATALLHGEMPTVAQAKELPLLDAVIRETQRLIPVVPSGLPRVAAHDVELDGYHIPRGSGLVCSIFAMHHEESLYPDAYAFLPERWDALRKTPAALTYRFLPFGAGPRRCLGGVLADYQLRATLAWLLQRFSFRVPEGDRVDYAIRQVALEPKRPLRLIVGGPDAWAKSAEVPQGTIRRMVTR